MSRSATQPHHARPSRTLKAPRTAAERFTTLAGRLTERDRRLCRLLWDHKVLTTYQVIALCFPSRYAATHRLLLLVRLGVLDRFRPFRLTGSAPFHYVLGELGAHVLAAERGLTTGELRLPPRPHAGARPQRAPRAPGRCQRLLRRAGRPRPPRRRPGRLVVGAALHPALGPPGAARRVRSLDGGGPGGGVLPGVRHRLRDRRPRGRQAGRLHRPGHRVPRSARSRPTPLARVGYGLS